MIWKRSQIPLQKRDLGEGLINDTVDETMTMNYRLKIKRESIVIPARSIVKCLVYKSMDLRVIVSKTRHTHVFDLIPPLSTRTNQLNPDKFSLRDRIFALRTEGKSYREIAAIVNIHFTRVRQILKEQD
jgi:hypothetical protein